MPEDTNCAVYTLSDLSRLLQVDQRTVTRWARSGKLPGQLVWPGNHPRFKASVVDAWLERRSQTSGDAA